MVVGDLMLDKYIHGIVDRISPEAPVPVIKVDREEFRLGGAANVAHNVCSLGLEADLIGALGTDDAASRFERLCEQCGIELHASVGLQSTTVKARIIAGKQQVARLDYEKFSANPEKLDRAVINLLEQQLPNSALVILSDYAKGLLSDEVVRFVVKWCKKNGIHVLIDPKRKDWETYHGASLLSPNFKEFNEAAGGDLENEDSIIEKCGKELRAQFDLKYLLITRSEKGMSLITESGCHHFPTVSREVFDISGAGDTAIATLGAALVKGYSFPEAVKLANKAAGIVIAKFGTAVISAKELEFS